MIVYRVEHRETKWGPYQFGNPVMATDWTARKLAQELEQKHSNWKLWPTHKAVGYRCAFASMRKLKEWFVGFEGKLMRAGYVLRVYKVKTWKFDEARKQLIFLAETAQLLETKAIT